MENCELDLYVSSDVANASMISKFGRGRIKDVVMPAGRDIFADQFESIMVKLQATEFEASQEVVVGPKGVEFPDNIASAVGGVLGAFSQLEMANGYRKGLEKSSLG